VKKAEDSNAWILRLYETAGRQSQTTVSFFQNIQSVAEVDLIEKAEQPVPAQKNRFQFTIQPHEIRTFKIQF
jgi:alpha-mannosidase